MKDLHRDKPLRVAFETLGCRSNYADTVSLQAAVFQQGGVPCSFEQAADVYVLNTCTVTDAADREAFRLIRKVRQSRPSARIIVTGCMAEVRALELKEKDGVEAVLGPRERQALLSAVFGGNSQEDESTRNECALVPLKARGSRKRNPGINLNYPLSAEISGPKGEMGEVTARARFHLRIQDGCVNHCTFCIIPRVRGAISSKDPKLVLDDLRLLADKGYEEVVLSGTHLGGYGQDCGFSLLELLKQIVRAKLPLRIRLSSIDPNDLSHDLVGLLSGSDVFCKHLHICVQAFSNPTLRRMARKYRIEDVEALLWYVHEQMPRSCIGSDVIAGFPGESRQEVDEGISRFLKLPISYLHVFPYSERKDTPALRLSGSVEVHERKRRASMWRFVGERRREEFFRSLIGQVLDVVVEKLEEEALYGTSGEYAFVKIPLGIAPVKLAEDLSAGRRVAVRAVSYEDSEGKLVCQL